MPGQRCARSHSTSRYKRRLGKSLFNDRLERYRKEKGLHDDDESMSEKDLVTFFKGESREIKRYALDSVRAAITHHPDNELAAYVEFGGKSTGKLLSYSTIEKTFLSFSSTSTRCAA